MNTPALFDAVEKNLLEAEGLVKAIYQQPTLSKIRQLNNTLRAAAAAGQTLENKVAAAVAKHQTQ